MSDSEEDASVERQVKISLVGEPSTGKSMLCTRYLGLHWPGLAAPTQGAEVLLGECPVRPNCPLVPVKFWDVAGNACNTTMLANYLYASDIVILVYDLTNLQSFDRLGQWLENVKNIFIKSDAKPIIAMFGNKSDLEHQRAVRLGCAQTFAEENDLVNFVGSARTGENINPTIISLVSQALGLPINKSLFSNPVIKAELAPHIKHHAVDKKKAFNITNAKDVNMNKKNIDNNQETVEKKDSSKKSNKKALRELKRKASSAVCNLQ